MVSNNRRPTKRSEFGARTQPENELNPPTDIVFHDLLISYSRKDLNFVRQLVAAMFAKGRPLWVDERSIAPTAEWPTEIKTGIEKAHTFIFVISPDSISSPRCLDELHYAVEQGKRLITLRHRGDVRKLQLPAPLDKIQWIDTGENDTIDDIADKLIKWIDIDLDWVSEHSRLQNSALDWSRNNKDPSFRLHGSKLQDALRWLSKQGDGKEPYPTELQKQFVLASQILEAQEMSRVRARQLAAQAELTKNQRPDLLQRSMLLAIESMRRLPSLEADRVLRDGIALLPKRLAEWHVEGNCSDIAFHPTGNHVFVACYGESARQGRGQIEMLDCASGKPIWHEDYQGEKNSIFICPNGRLLATVALIFEPIIRIFDAHTGKQLFTLPHKYNVHSLCFSANGQFLATAVDHPCTYIWDTSTGRLLARSAHERGNRYKVQSVAIAFSPDSRRIITGSYDHTARIWDVPSGKEIYRIENKGAINEVAWSGDGRFVAIVSDQAVSIRDAGTGKAVATVWHANSIRAIAFSHDGQLLLTGSWDETACVWEPATGRELVRVDHGGQIRRAFFAPDARSFVTQGWNDAVRVWNTRTGRELARIIDRHGSTVSAFSPDSEYLATGAGRNISLWQAAAAPEAPLLGHRHIVMDLDFSPDGSVLATGSADSAARLWALPAGMETAQLAHKSQVARVKFSPNGSFLATASRTPDLRIWDPIHGKLEWAEKQSCAITTLSFSPDGRYLATATGDILHAGDKAVSVWQSPAGRLVATLRHPKRVIVVAYSPIGTLLATGSYDRFLRLWDPLTELIVKQFPHRARITCLAFAPDGHAIAAGSIDCVSRIWNVETGKCLARMRHASWVDAIQYSPCGKYIATASPDSAVLWDAETGRELSRIRHDSSVVTIAFSPEGNRLATVDWDHTVHLWSVPEAREIARLTHSSEVKVIAFSPDGRYLATGGDLDGLVRLWLLQPEDLLAEACSRLTANLTLDEWRTYFDNEPYTLTVPEIGPPDET